MYEVARLVLIGAPIRLEAKGLQIRLTLLALHSYIVPDKANDINLGRNVCSFKSVIQIESSQKLFVYDVVLAQDNLSARSVQNSKTFENFGKFQIFQENGKQMLRE